MQQARKSKYHKPISRILANRAIGKYCLVAVIAANAVVAVVDVAASAAVEYYCVLIDILVGQVNLRTPLKPQ